MTPTKEQLDKEFPKLNDDGTGQDFVVQGLEVAAAGVPGVAIGALDDTPAAAPAAPAEPQQALTPAERIQQDQELAEYVKRQIEAENSKAVNGYKQKREAQLQAEASAKANAEMLQLYQRAAQGDESATLQLGQTKVAEFLKQHSAEGITAQYVQEFDQAAAQFAGDDPERAAALAISSGRYASTAEWLAALRADAVAKEHEMWQRDLDKLAEAKAIDLLASQRNSLATLDQHMTDLNQPAGFGTPSGTWRQGDWQDYASACRQWNDGLISDQEMAMARRLLDEGRIKMGQLGVD